MPRVEDSYPAPALPPMGPIGPWATGKVDWSPLAGLTGTRPIVDHYSITRYSDGEWRKHNEDVLCCTADDLHRVNMYVLLLLYLCLTFYNYILFNNLYIITLKYLLYNFKLKY